MKIIRHLKTLAINPFFAIPLFGIILVNIWQVNLGVVYMSLSDVEEGLVIKFGLWLSLAITTILYLISIIFNKIINGLNLWGPILPAGLILMGLWENTYLSLFIVVFILSSVGIFYGCRYLGNKFENYFIEPNF
jgi:hypothetical protein